VYAGINGLTMFYQIGGTSDPGQVPLVLLHGAISATGTSSGPLPDLLAQTRQVIAVEQQGHGRTADISRPMPVQAMADDTLALLARLGIAQPGLFGYSLGAGIALNIITSHPAVVRKAVLASVTYDKTGLHPEMSGARNPGSPQRRPDTTCRSPSSRNTGRWPPTRVTGPPWPPRSRRRNCPRSPRRPSPRSTSPSC
jgi:pimeloyl-ACP methyl ester carboxylesterase